MKLSTKGHYGLHAMMDLGSRYGQGAVLLRDLCELHGFSEKYLEQLLRSLRQAGLVESVRGARGGYWLARPPETITLLQIVEALEGELNRAPSQCDADCLKKDSCSLQQSWSAATTAMRRVLEKITLLDLLREQQKLDQEKSPPEYAI